MTLLPKRRKHGQEFSPLPPLCPDPAKGLTAEQAEERRRLGYANTPVDPPGKSVGQIVFSHVFTWFNLIFFLLAACVAAVRAWNNLLFMGVVLTNMVIGVVQELRSKRTLDRLNLLSAPRAVVVRDGREVTVSVSETVRDDIVLLKSGDQVFADALAVSGECQVNEALVTGEADEIPKRPGDALLSGSFLVSGTCRARLTAVGADSYAGRLTLEAKRRGRQQQGEMMRSLSRLVKWIGVLILPLGAVMALKEIRWLGRRLAEGVVSTVAAMVGMIPEGLYLLTSLALLAGVLRLARRHTLVHEMRCIETLARVDTLCVDKTGTITSERMCVEAVIPLCEREIGPLMADYLAAAADENETSAALRAHFGGAPQREAEAVLPFTSSRKYGGVRFRDGETCLLGAPEVLLGDRCGELMQTPEQFSAQGCRVLLLAACAHGLGETPGEDLRPLAFITLRNPIRPEAAETFRYFTAQGVAIKVLSGDSHRTAAEAARRAGIPGADRSVDARTLETDALLAEAAARYTVFGRVTPEQKRALVLALKARGHTVAMTGDGVNDVLALKEADCSVAMASGSAAAQQVSNIVLLRSDFSAMPSVVAEGRRVINNIERSAALFLVKNIFSFALTLFTLVLALPYPFSAAQLSLVSILTIGFPSFVLAMEPNADAVKGRFLPNVLRRALPPAATDLLLTVGVMAAGSALGFPAETVSTVCALTAGVVGVFTLARIGRPLTPLRKLLIAAVAAAFLLSAVFLKELFSLAPLDGKGMLLLAAFALSAWPALRLASWLSEFIFETYGRKKRKQT